jgi:hypothetical protein
MKVSLNHFFALQDRASASNREEVSEGLGLLDRVLQLAWTSLIEIHTTSELEHADPSRRVIGNLLYAASAILVSAARLGLAGDHVGALTLTRLAFEDVYHAEFFRHRPGLAEEWETAGRTGDAEERRKRVEAFEKKHAVRTFLEHLDDPMRTRTRLFHQLSSFGTHTTPATVAMRPPNLGFVSRGKPEATRFTIGIVLHVAEYALSEIADSFGDFLTTQAISEARAIRADYHLYQASVPAELSPFR